MDIDPSPLGNTAEEAASWVRAEIERSMPPGWRVTGFDRNPLIGDITPIDHQHDGITSTGYGVRISGGLDFLLFTWGNSDQGPLSLDHVMERALVIQPMFLRMFGMAACLQQLVNKFPRNHFGLT